jgi:hypothetical protein
MNNPNQNYNHSEPRQEKDQFRHTAQVPITVPKYRVTIEHGSIGRSRERWVSERKYHRSEATNSRNRKCYPVCLQ